MLKVVFFGQLKELLKTPELQIEAQLKTVAELREYLQTKGDIWHEYLAFGKALVAVNHTMASDDITLEKNDEVAFFPPVTGG